jgi:hypothetical protein
VRESKGFAYRRNSGLRKCARTPVSGMRVGDEQVSRLKALTVCAGQSMLCLFPLRPPTGRHKLNPIECKLNRIFGFQGAPFIWRSLAMDSMIYCEEVDSPHRNASAYLGEHRRVNLVRLRQLSLGLVTQPSQGFSI